MIIFLISCTCSFSPVRWSESDVTNDADPVGDRHHVTRSVFCLGDDINVTIERFLGVATTYSGLLACRFFLGLLEGESIYLNKELSIISFTLN